MYYVPPKKRRQSLKKSLLLPVLFQGRYQPTQRSLLLNRVLIGHFPHGIKEERGRGLYTTRYTHQDEIRQCLTNFSEQSVFLTFPPPFYCGYMALLHIIHPRYKKGK